MIAFALGRLTSKSSRGGVNQIAPLTFADERAKHRAYSRTDDGKSGHDQHFIVVTRGQVKDPKLLRKVPILYNQPRL